MKCYSKGGDATPKIPSLELPLHLGEEHLYGAQTERAETYFEKALTSCIYIFKLYIKMTLLASAIASVTLQRTVFSFPNCKSTFLLLNVVLLQARSSRHRRFLI